MVSDEKWIMGKIIQHQVKKGLVPLSYWKEMFDFEKCRKIAGP